jgi:hypothetical protein
MPYCQTRPTRQTVPRQTNFHDKTTLTALPLPPYNNLTFSAQPNNAPSLFWPLGPCWALWKCPCSTVLGSWKGSPERLSKCLGAFHLLNCTTKAVTQAAGQGILRLDSRSSLGMRWTKRLGSSEFNPKSRRTKSVGPVYLHGTSYTSALKGIPEQTAIKGIYPFG